MRFEDLPLRGKVTSDGEEARKCTCGGRCYVFYDEDRQYHIECENCGTVVNFTSSNLDRAIKFWNDMPTALGTYLNRGRCCKGSIPEQQTTEVSSSNLILPSICKKARFRNMKIGITGSQGTGKTTLANALAEVLGLPLITEQVRKVAKDRGIESLEEVRADMTAGRVFQEACLRNQLSAEKGLNDFISDRTTIDNAAYWLKHHAHHWPSRVSNIYYSTAFRNIRNYDLILYVPPELMPVDDGFRDTDRQYQLEIDFYIRCFLAQSGANCITVSGSIEERVDRVLYEISTY